MYRRTRGASWTISGPATSTLFSVLIIIARDNSKLLSLLRHNQRDSLLGPPVFPFFPDFPLAEPRLESLSSGALSLNGALREADSIDDDRRD